MEVADRIYTDMPLFLSEPDYARIDSLLAIPGYVARKIAEDKEMLLFPSSQFLAHNISRDPLISFRPCWVGFHTLASPWSMRHTMDISCRPMEQRP